MRIILRHSVIACLLVVCAVYCRAELTANTHNFDAMRKGTPTLTFTGTTYGEATIPPVLAYQGGGGGTFAYDDSIYKYLFQLPSNGSTMETLSAVEDLVRFAITRAPNNAANVKFYISSDDGEHWTEVSPVTPIGTYSIEVRMPAKGDYRIKIERTSGSTMNIQAITYYTDPCNCLQVVTE